MELVEEFAEHLAEVAHRHAGRPRDEQTEQRLTRARTVQLALDNLVIDTPRDPRGTFMDFVAMYHASRTIQWAHAIDGISVYELAVTMVDGHVILGGGYVGESIVLGLPHPRGDLVREHGPPHQKHQSA